MLNNDFDAQLQSLICTVDTPAFLRRRQSVDASWKALVLTCQRQREEWLTMPRLRFRQWKEDETRSAAYERLDKSVDLFNRRWTKFLGELDVSEINRIRQGYNDFYVLEKECAGVSPKVARSGFQTLPPVTLNILLETFPLLTPENVPPEI